MTDILKLEVARIIMDAACEALLENSGEHMIKVRVYPSNPYSTFIAIDNTEGGPRYFAIRVCETQKRGARNA